MRRGLILPNWVAGDDVDLLVEAAVTAEDAGWDGVFLADHLVFPPPSDVGGSERPFGDMPMPDPWVTHAAIAAHTEKIRLGSWITPIGRRQPWQAARDLATLDRLSGGRVLLGVGLGRRSDHAPFGTPWDLPAVARKTDEALALLEAFWSGAPVDHHGEYFDVDGVTLLPRPVQRPRIPVLAGGLWPNRAVIRRGARWDGIVPHFPGDGVLPGDETTPEKHLQALVAAYLQEASEPGEVMVLDDPPAAADDWQDLAAELGVTWLLTAKRDGEWRIDLEEIAAGPTD